MPFKPGSETWSLNIGRIIKRKGESVRWADPFVNRILTDMSRAGVLEGMTSAQDDIGLGLDVVPAGTLRRVDDRIEDRHYTEYTPSLDWTYRF